jgi:hypothetical protein
MSADTESYSNIFRDLYSGWIAALQQRDYTWFERHMSEDFSCSTHPIPGLAMTKSKFIEGEKMIEVLKAQTLKVHAHPVNDVVISIWVLKMEEEVLNPKIGEIYGPNFPSVKDFSTLVVLHRARPAPRREAGGP